ncbi:MAG: hypothetical protein IT423_12670 [Pirellulaceae bacterium]|nr:hypothetical protein [Pirellulaceae bacterium]
MSAGLTLKLVAMWLIFPAMLVPWLWPTYLGLLTMALVPLLIDFVGRCYCAQAPVEDALPIRLSILAQFTGILGLTIASIWAGLGGVLVGLIWAAVCQFSAAKWFIKHLRAIALSIDQPAIAVGMDQLRQRLLATTMSAYGSGAIAIVVLSCAVVFGIMAYGIGLLITLPLAFLMLMPVVMSTMVLYFLMLYSYERHLNALRHALRKRGQVYFPQDT